MNDQLRYPNARRDEDFKEIFHGQEIADPYHWLSDPDSNETKEFVRAQNEITEPYIGSVPSKSKIKESLATLWNYPKFGSPMKKGSRYFYQHNSGLQNQYVLYILDRLDGKPEEFLNPNKLAADGTISLSMARFSKNGEMMAYGLSKSGSDWVSINIKIVESGDDMDDLIERVKFSTISWTHDNKGFFYSTYAKAEGKTDGTETTGYTNHKLYYHKLGTLQKEDILCVEFTDHPHWRITGVVSDCGRLLILEVREDCKNNMLFYTELVSSIEGPLEVKPIVDTLDSKYDYITNEGDILTVHTDRNSPNSRLINIDVNNVKESSWRELIPEKNFLMEWVECVAKDKLIVCYLKDVKHLLFCCDLKTGKEIWQFPLEIGTISQFKGEKDEMEIFYMFVSFLNPGIVYHCDLAKYPIESRIFKQIEVENLNPGEFTTKQVNYPSTDGTRIPMFITHQKGLENSFPAPCLLYGYGGFSINLVPSFSPFRVFFVQKFGGISAIANIRGGGEYGEKWHDGGRMHNKKNSFEDFISAIRYLCNQGYTTPNQVTIQGGSNGGLLVAAVANHAPELVGCAIVQVGVLDMLRFHRYTIGRAWCSDYGCSDDPEYFKYLLSYSPLHNVRAPPSGVQYPATLLLTADHDDRVVPLHSLKFVAELQHTVGSLPQQTRPLLIRVDTKAGHGGGKPTQKLIEDLVDILCFMIKTLDLRYIDASRVEVNKD